MLITKTMEIAPNVSRTKSSLTRAASSQPAAPDDTSDGWALQAVYALEQDRLPVYAGQRLDVVLSPSPVASPRDGE